jgi:hypothetical protein
MLKRTSDVSVTNVRIVNWNNFPLSIAATPGAKLNVEIKYDRNRFAAGDMAWIAQRFESLMHAIINQPQAKLHTLLENLVEADQQRKITREADYQDQLRSKLRRTIRTER